MHTCQRAHAHINTDEGYVTKSGGSMGFTPQCGVQHSRTQDGAEDCNMQRLLA